MRWGEPAPVHSLDEWHEWLALNHDSETEVFLLLLKERSSASGIRYNDAVEEALCFGWIDGVAHRFDDDYSLNRFTPRRPKSNWSASNRDRIRRLLAEGRLTAAGLAVLPPELRPRQ